MAWYKFNSIADFNAWHEVIKNALGYPFPSIDANGNECEPLNTEYTSVQKINGEFKAFVDDVNAAGLTLTSEPIYPPSHDFS